MILKISNIVGQIAVSRVSLDNQLLNDAERDEFQLNLGRGQDLKDPKSKTLRITTLIIDTNAGATKAGMQVSLNGLDYTPLCEALEANRFTFFVNITFF